MDALQGAAAGSIEETCWRQRPSARGLRVRDAARIRLADCVTVGDAGLLWR